jgi:hypothetical protein
MRNAELRPETNFQSELRSTVMSAMRPDSNRPDRISARRLAGCWKQEKIRDLDEASHAADAVLLSLKRAHYSQRDIEGMRIALEEAIANVLLDQGCRQPLGVCLAIRYRVNEAQAVVEVDGSGEYTGLFAQGSLTEEPLLATENATPFTRSCMTWIRYNRKNHSATVCRCSLLA